MTINNKYLPLKAGTTFVYRAESDDGCEENRVTVTSATKAIAAGVTARIVEDIGFIDEQCDGTLVKHEETFDWFAQDRFGNIWYLGEDTRTCDPSGCNNTEGSWEAGVDGAVAGLIMLADPQPGDGYRQEFYEGVAEDEARVLQVNAWVSLYRPDSFGTSDFHGCLKTKEWTTLEQGNVEHKFYCPDTGLVAVEEHKGKTVRFELISITPAP